MKEKLHKWFRDLVSERVVLDVRPADVKVVLDEKAIAASLCLDVNRVMLACLREAIIESKKPPEPVTRGPQPDSDVPAEPTLESELLAKLSPDIQEAARYSCRKVQKDPSHPKGGRTLGNNWHRDEACEWAKIWLNERSLTYRDSDVNLACELYYRVYIKGVKQ